MRGSLSGITGTTQIATIPQKYRSSQAQLIFAVSNSGLQLNSSGELYTLQASGTIGINCTWFVD